MFQRMMVIPQEEYLQLTAVQQVKQPLMQQFYNLESKYQEQDHIADPYRKLMHQSETLDAMKTLKEKMRNEIVLATPKPYQSRARSLFQHLEPILKFNERGEIFDEQGQMIPQSRIDDLIQYAVRDRRRHFLPVGWSSFLKAMQDHNIPKYMLNRNTLDEMKKLVSKPEIKTEGLWSRLTAKRRIKQEITTSKAKKRAVSFSPFEEEVIRQKSQRKRKPSEKYGSDFLKRF